MRNFVDLILFCQKIRWNRLSEVKTERRFTSLSKLRAVLFNKHNATIVANILLKLDILDK